jgi:hypothetical protein
VPLAVEIDDERKTVFVRAEGQVTPADIREYLTAVGAAGAMAYGKLIDTTSTDVVMPSVQEMLDVGRSMRDYTKTGGMGPLAIVVDGHTRMTMAQFADAAGPHRPIRIFASIGEAKLWLRRET